MVARSKKQFRQYLALFCFQKCNYKMFNPGHTAPPQTDRIVNYLTDLEQVAEEILTDRQTIIDYDRKRNANRESLRDLRKSDEKKTWIAMGNTFFKLEKTAVESMIQKGMLHFVSMKCVMYGMKAIIQTNFPDQKKLDTAINELRDNLKQKVDKVRDIEEKPALKGFNLKPLNPDEMRDFRIPSASAYTHRP